MQQVVPFLWIGGISAAYDTAALQKNGIHSVLSALNGDIEVHPTFLRHHVPIEDSDDADILVFLPAAVAFIEKEVDKSRGVLVHCVAGVSRSATIVAAYLMYSRHIEASDALNRIRSVRPQIGPNDGFLRQLDLFYDAAFKLSLQDKCTRIYYLEQAVKRIQSGRQVNLSDIILNDGKPRPTDRPERRIRCKMCRQDLAGRNDMSGHRLPEDPLLTQVSLGDANLSSSSKLFPLEAPAPADLPKVQARRRSSGKSPGLSALSGLTMSSLKSGSALLDEEDPPLPSPSAAKLLAERQRRASMDGAEALHDTKSSTEELDEQLSGTLTLEEPQSKDYVEAEGAPTPQTYISSGIVASSLSDKLASLRNPSTDLPRTVTPLGLADPQCSGYFLEPMKWMEAFLAGGDISGKIICPNLRCKAKVGNFAWTGMHCSCHDWVVPGFCISRSKVDEVTK